jgi:hypothetical protein
MDLPGQLCIVLVGVLYPLWLLAGLFDYWCHRQTDIGRTSGTTESWLHIAQFASLALFLSFACFLAITLPVAVAMAVAVFAHSALSYIDVSYTQGRRHISPFEQHVHGFLDVLPFVALCLIVVLNWEEVRSAEWSIRLKDQRLPTEQLGWLLGSFALAGVPIIEELSRTWRQRHQARILSELESPQGLDVSRMR